MPHVPLVAGATFICTHRRSVSRRKVSRLCLRVLSCRIRLLGPTGLRRMCADSSMKRGPLIPVLVAIATRPIEDKNQHRHHDNEYTDGNHCGSAYDPCSAAQLTVLTTASEEV